MIELVGADFLKLRKRRGLYWWSLILTVGSMLLVSGVKVVLHAKGAAGDGPAGERELRPPDGRAVRHGGRRGRADRVDSGQRRSRRGRVPRPRRDWPQPDRAVARAYPRRARADHSDADRRLRCRHGRVLRVRLRSRHALGLAGGVGAPGAFILASGTLACVLALGLAELIGSRGIAIGVLLGVVPGRRATAPERLAARPRA